MSLPPSHFSDELATAYVQIVAASAGCTVSVQRRDYGVDVTLRQILETEMGYLETGFPVDIQIKSTISIEEDADEVRYDLKATNYNKIVARGRRSAPYYLALIVFPVSIKDWMRLSPEDLVLRARGFWWSSSDDQVANSSTRRVRLPKAQRLTEHSLVEMLIEAAARYE